MERKIMHKAKGRWVVLSSSLLLSAIALNLAVPIAHAQEVTDESAMVEGELSTTDVPVEASQSLTNEEAALVEELVSEVISADEALLVDETIVEPDVPPLETETEAEVVAEAPVMFANLRVASGTYSVANGDTLWKIATKHGITVAQLRAWNTLSGDKIFIGDQLVVANPGTPTEKPVTPTPAPTPEPTPTPEPAPTTSQTYTVRPGDYLYKIASANNITVAQLKTWNNLTSNYIPE